MHRLKENFGEAYASDVMLLKDYKVHTIYDLMVENEKRKIFNLMTYVLP